MSPTTSDMYARAQYYDSSICHPWQVACMQEHDAQNPSQTIPWLILQKDRKTQGPPLEYKYIKNPRSTLGTHSSKPQGPPLEKLRRLHDLPPNWLAKPSTRSKSNILLTNIRGKAPQSKRKPYQMGDKTFNQVEIKSEMISCHLLFARPPQSYLYIAKFQAKG
ncbi:hypothetical protein HKD37_11G031815 [Glycine soja]